MKKLLLLGGSRYIVPVIKQAHEMGIYVITCDYLPNSVAHKYSDEYHNVSVIDKDAVLKLAQNLRIDGIMSFACDPGVVSAAYAAECFGLPFQCSYDAAAILQDKGRFRRFLKDHGFNVPYAKDYGDKKAAMQGADEFRWPIIVKPVDSAGSKGVSKVESKDGLKHAIDVAFEASHCERIIMEEFLEFEGYHSSGDCFSVAGELQFVTFSDQLFDERAENPYTPSRIIWPTSMRADHQEALSRDIQRVMHLLKMDTGIYNIETCVANHGKTYLMEISPRGGGCKIAEIQKLAYGVDLIENEIRSAIGVPVQIQKKGNCDGYWCEMIIHATPGKSGRFFRMEIDENIAHKYIRVLDLDVKEGDVVKPFTGANMALGDMFLRFDSRKELDDVMTNATDWLRIKLSGDINMNSSVPNGWIGDKELRCLFGGDLYIAGDRLLAFEDKKAVAA